MCARWLESEINETHGSEFQITPSRVRELDPSRYRLYWLHDLPFDPETNHLKDAESRSRFHRLVFCGNWQRTLYQAALGVPIDENAVVIDTPSMPVSVSLTEKMGEKIHLVYTSTPQRGLDILVPVFLELAKIYPSIHLDVFSSFKIYGWDTADAQFEEIFKICREHPQITYHGVQPNEVVRKHLAKSHIFAYPSTWMECNSRSLIEAMSACLICVHSDLGGLPDTSGGLTRSYTFSPDKQKHAQIFYQHLDTAIKDCLIGIENHSHELNAMSIAANARFHPNKILQKWLYELEKVKYDYGLVGITPPQNKVIEFKL